MTKKQVLEKLNKVLDPELGISVVELGLIYEIKNHGDNVDILLTLTTPFCPLSGIIKKRIEEALTVEKKYKVNIELTFNPPWSADRISPEGRQKLGLLS